MAVVANKGPDSALDVMYRQTLPAGAQVVGARASQGSCRVEAEVACALGLMGRANQSNGATTTIELTLVAVLSGPISSGTMTTRGSASSASLAMELIPENTTAEASLDVAAYTGPLPAADLAVRLAAPKTAKRGRLVTAVASVWNIGPSTAEGVRLAGRSLGSLGVGESRTVKVTTRAKPGLRFSVRAVAATPDPQPRNDSAVALVRVRAA